MEPPAEDKKASTEATPPDFSALDEPCEIVRTGKTREQIYTTVLQLDEPATVAEIAERADPGVDATREYLRWFADMGLVSRTQKTPEQYVVNREYLCWRRADRLRKEYSEAELVGQLQAVTEEIEQYRKLFDATTPDEIVLQAYADEHGTDVAVVWEDLCTWETASEQQAVISRALEMRRQNSDQSVGSSDSNDDTGLEA